MATSIESDEQRDVSAPNMPARPVGGGFALLGPWPAHWPLTVLIVGYPLWWMLGFAGFFPIVLAIPMAVQLARRRVVRVPRGFTWWLLFLVWVMASGTMLFVDAPFAVPGGDAGRVLVFGYRAGWYAACTVVMLWVANQDEQSLPSQRVVRLFGWMFVVTSLGGLLGVVAPTLELQSLLEMVLPRGLSDVPLIKAMIEPRVASIQSVLGEEGARPLAPFPYANTWGASLSMFLPFFIVGWLGKDAGWRRAFAPLLIVAAIPVVASLNRALWVSLIVGAAFVVIRWVLRGRVLAVLAAVLGLAILGMAFFASPLGDVFEARVDNPHSNDRRGQLLSQTVQSAAEGSPVVGFGSTRDVQGSFASIAGGGTPECPACRVPPLGTQGQIWFVIFAQGLVGVAWFVIFFATQMGRHWRSRSSVEAIGVCLLVFLFMQVFVYDTLGMPMYTAMAAIGLMCRDRGCLHDRAGGRSLGSLLSMVRRYRVLIVVLALLGAAVGLTMAVNRQPVFAAQVSIELAPSPVHLDPSGLAEPREITIDTEASMVISERALSQVVDEVGLSSAADLRDSVRVTAAPLTRVLVIQVTDTDRSRAEVTADALAAAYLQVRNEYLAQRRDQVILELSEQLRFVAGTGVTQTMEADASDENQEGAISPDPVLVETELRDAIQVLQVTPARAGDVLRSATTNRTRRQAEVPVVSGALVGLLLGLSMMAVHDGWTRRR